MNQVAVTVSAESRRMELRATIRLASEIIANYWPMRTFVHHNPLHGLEDLRFDEAVRRGREILGGEGYLSRQLFRQYYRAGRIRAHHLDRALNSRATGSVVELGGRRVSHLEVMRAQLVHDLTPPGTLIFERLLQSSPDRRVIALLAERIPSLRPQAVDTSAASKDARVNETLAESCDRMFGTQIAELINREMIKWCEAFLDEGHATWAMPYREQGFYRAWKLLARREWSPCGITGSRAKIARLPAHPEDCLLECLADLGIDPDAWQDYLSRQLAALSGWAGLIKWRADQSEYEWQRAYPIDLVQYLAVRLWYERELVQIARNAHPGGEEAPSTNPEPPPSPDADSTLRDGPNRNSVTAAWRLAGLARALGAALPFWHRHPTKLYAYCSAGSMTSRKRSMARSGLQRSRPVTMSN